MFKDMYIPEELVALYKAQDEAEEIVPCTNDPDMWFPKQGSQYNVGFLRELCANCPVVLQCAEYGIEHELEHGIWGGLSPRERQRINRSRRIAMRLM